VRPLKGNFRYFERDRLEVYRVLKRLDKMHKFSFWKKKNRLSGYKINFFSADHEYVEVYLYSLLTLSSHAAGLGAPNRGECI
jgi:hypothetical protein